MNDQIASTIKSYRYAYSNEKEFQDGIGRALAGAGIKFSREHVLSERDTVDFLVQDIGIEVKIKGAPFSVIRQLCRYAEHDAVGALILVTARNQLRAMPALLNGKSVSVIYVGSF